LSAAGVRVIGNGKHWRIHNFNLGGGAHGERGARTYNGGLGAEPLAGFRGRAPGEGGEAPEAESILVLGRPTDTANLHPWPVAVFFSLKQVSNLNQGRSQRGGLGGLGPP